MLGVNGIKDSQTKTKSIRSRFSGNMGEGPFLQCLVGYMMKVGSDINVDVAHWIAVVWSKWRLLRDT